MAIAGNDSKLTNLMNFLENIQYIYEIESKIRKKIVDGDFNFLMSVKKSGLGDAERSQ